MFSNPFNLQGNNRTEIDTFLRSVFQDNWNYLEALGLTANELEQVPFEQIVNNPGDLVDGVIKVELKLHTRFFNLFDNLIIKHRSDASISLMFFAEVRQSAPVLAFYAVLKASLGGGIVKESRFSSFNQTAKVQSLAAGKFETEKDEIVHTWLNDNITITLNYKLSPLRQFLLLVGIKPEKQPDLQFRNKGTILNILQHDIREIVKQTEIKAETTYADEQVKFVDYTFNLDPPELGIFEQMRIRIFDKNKRIDEQIQTHVTYYSKYEVDISAFVIR